MYIALKCEVSLSKKLRQYLKGFKNTLTLNVLDIKNGKGEAALVLSSDYVEEFPVDDIKSIGETSIMITPVDVHEEIPDENSVGNIFSAHIQSDTGRNRDAVDKLAARNVSNNDVAHDIVKSEEIEVPQDLKPVQQLLNDPECKAFITDLQELSEAINKAKHKKSDSDIDLSTASNDRERAIMAEMMERSEAIDEDAWIVNRKAGMVAINDIGVDLPRNSPYNLSNISAKRLALSKDLRGVIKSGFVEFVSPKEAKEIQEQVLGGQEEEDDIIETAVFDSVKSARESFDQKPVSKDVIPIDDEETLEEESMIINLTQNMPKNSLDKNTRKTTHGNVSAKPAPISQVNTNPNANGPKPIRKLS